MDSTSDAANFFAERRFEQRAITTIPDALCPPDIAAGYVIQEVLVKRLVARRGGHQAGYKVACTSETAQRIMHTDAPVFGRLLSAAVHESPARLRANAFTTRIIEAEFGFRMARDVPAACQAYDRESIAGYVADALPAIEIVDHRMPDLGTLDALTLAADNAIHGAWVYGEVRCNWRALDLRSHAASLRVNGELHSSGDGSRVLGHPLEVLAWLANELPKFELVLRAGDFVTTGLCTDIYEAEAGDVVQADFGKLGRVELHFD